MKEEWWCFCGAEAGTVPRGAALLRVALWLPAHQLIGGFYPAGLAAVRGSKDSGDWEVWRLRARDCPRALVYLQAGDWEDAAGPQCDSGTGGEPGLPVLFSLPTPTPCLSGKSSSGPEDLGR